ETMTAEHGAVRVPRSAAEVLAPAIARVAGTAQAIARIAATEVRAHVVHGELLRVRARDPRTDPGVEAECRDAAAAGATAIATGGDPAAGPGAVHQAKVVALDGPPAAATDRAATALRAVGRARRRPGRGRGRLGWIGLRDDREAALGRDPEGDIMGARRRGCDGGHDLCTVWQLRRRIEHEDRVVFGERHATWDALAIGGHCERRPRR